MRVIVYRNLQRGGWSVAALEGKRTIGKVQAHVAAVALADVEFVVLPGKHKEVVLNDRRTVCAFAIGTLLEGADAAPQAGAEVVAYNPFRAYRFTAGEALSPVSHAARVDFAADDRAHAVGITTEEN